jgi:integrase
LIVRDEACRGLALIVNAAAMTWSYSYRPRGTDPATGARWPNRTMVLGTPSSLSPDEARDAANRAKGQAKAGGDPAVERREAAQAKAEAEAARKRRGVTVAQLLGEYEKALPKRPKLRGTGLPSAGHVADEIAHARAATAAAKLGDRPVVDVAAADLRAIASAEAARPATARARFGAFTRFLDWALETGRITANPATALPRSRRPKAVASRAHHLPLADLARLWHAAERLAPVHRDLARFLIALPCRRGEAARVDWAHINLNAAVWSQPGALTKNDEPHRFHLHPLALDILQARNAAAGAPNAGLVFPAPKSGKSVDTFSDLAATLCEATGITGWRWHDLRRSFATVLGEQGADESVLDAILNHRQAATRSGVLGTYQRAVRWPAQVSAMTAWGEALAGALAKPVDGT